MFEVIVGNVGQVWVGNNGTNARIEARQWVAAAKRGGTRADPHAIVMKDGEIVAEYGEQG